MKLRILHRTEQFRCPYVVQRERKFLWFRWWSFLWGTHYLERAEDYIARYYQTVGVFEVRDGHFQRLQDRPTWWKT